MLELFETGKALSVFAVIGAIGIISKLITRSLYRRLIKDTENMAMTKNRNLKLLKQKLENAYRLNQNIVNTQAYLDKQIYGFKFMHISLNAWNNVSLQMTILGLFAGGICSFMSYWYRLDSYYIILYAAVGALGSLFLTFLDSSFNIPFKQQRLSNSLLEYVDNSVFVRAVRENVERGAGRDYAAASCDLGAQGFENSREKLIRENEVRDGLVHREEPLRGSRNLKNRNAKAQELLRTVRNLKKESQGPDGEDESSARNVRPERGPALRGKNAVNMDRKNDGIKAKAARDSQPERGGDFKETLREKESEACRDIDYLKHSLEQIAASKEKNRENDDWAKNLKPDELKVIGEIMRQYFSGT